MGAAQPIMSYITTIPTKDQIEQQLTPPVLSWIDDTFTSLNEVQRMAIPRIISNSNTLVMAPTGAGKTLAAFLGIISELQRLENEGRLEEKIYALYVSPLKALNNDIHKNLEVPLEEIKLRSGSIITAAKRTGDTPTKERQRLLRNPPHILITTPESLGLMLAAPKFKENLRDIRWLILDEIHSIADNKRGTHLSLSLERLEYYLDRPLTRIGLSATVEPPELVGNYLVGSRNVPLGIIDRGGLRQLDLEVITPTRNLVHAPFSLIENQQLDYLERYIQQNRTTLIFTNTRHLSERLVVELTKRVDKEIKDKIAVHHGSLDKEVRLEVENKLKKGEMKAVFTSTSLEMGIDIGSIDLTVQLGSPKTVRALLQRIGRSGHSQELVSRGKVLVFGRDDLLECAVIAKLAKEGKIDAIRVPEAPVDVLIQILVGMAIEKKWDFQEAYDVITSAYPYRNMSFDIFLQILRTAADPTENEDSWKYGHIWLDEEIEEFGRRKSARQAYLQNIGTIPDSTTINVVLQGFRNTIGQIAEKFAERLQENDIFVLGGKSFEFIRAVGSKILVETAPGRVPTVPSWGGEAQTRTFEISKELDRMLSTVENFLDTNRKNAVTWIKNEYPVDTVEAEAIVDYIIEQLGIAPLPKLDQIIVEKYVDPTGAMNILFLMIYGLETNQALAQGLAQIVSEKIQNNIGVLATDNGILLRIPPGYDIDHGDLFSKLAEVDLTNYVMKSLRETEMFKVRFRHAAARALMILRRWGRRTIPVSRQQRTARWLLRNLDDDMVVVDETYREILYDTYNLSRALDVIQQLKTGDIQVLALEQSEVPSSFTHDILLNGELDVVMMEDRRNLLASLHQQVISRILPELAEYETILDPEEVNQYFEDKMSPEIDRELLLHRLAEFPMETDQLDWAENQWNNPRQDIEAWLKEQETIWQLHDGRYINLNHLPLLAATVGDEFWDNIDLSHPEIEQAYLRFKEISPDEGWEHLILKSLEFGGPQTANELATRLQTNSERLEAILRKLQRTNVILQGSFTADTDQYLRSQDREQLSRTGQSEEIITEDQLKNYRLYRMRLLKRNQSDKISILNYLKENGPARDPIELVSRLSNFQWTEMRGYLGSRDVYFGRFLGRRLVFVHYQDLEDLVSITRDKNVELSDISCEILQLLSERPGLTQKELSSLLNYPSSSIGDGIKQLENQLYISRTGFELTLTHGGFPNPRYIALPQIEITEKKYDTAVANVLERCCHWYGPLTLHDLLRITRLPYPVVEAGLQRTELIPRKILNTTYYGHDYNYEVLNDLAIKDHELEEVYLLSPLDPYFYMTSGSFRRDFLPRQTRLTIIHEGMPKGHIEISIPDKDILQIINLQISKRRMRNYNFIRKIGIKIRDLAELAYQTPVVFIEEIGFKAANHPDNRIIVTTLEEVGYQLHIDHLISGTGQKHEFSKQDVYATRQIIRQLQEHHDYNDFSRLIDEKPIFSPDQVLSMLNAPSNKSQLLISHHLRKGQIHYKGGLLYRDDIFRVLYGISGHPESQVFNALNKPKSRIELTKEFNRPEDEIAQELYDLVKQNLVEIISPFGKTTEYRRMPLKNMSLGKQLQVLVEHFITTQGPLNFNELQEMISNHMDSSRTQLLIILTTLLKSGDISSAAIRKEPNASQEIMYFTPKQAEILGDPGKSRYFDGWRIYETRENIFDLKNKDSHVMVNNGKLVGSFSYDRENDSGVIKDLNIVAPEMVSDNPIEIITEIENYVFGKGMKRLEIRKLGGAIPQYWLDLS